MGGQTRPGAKPGLRVSETAGLNRGDVCLGAGAHVRCEGKGRKQRAVPLTGPTQAVLREWTRERGGRAEDPLFPTRTGRRLSRDAVERRVSTHTAVAARQQPSLHGQRVSPHVLRHSAAMSLLHAGVDTSVIALWLGHFSGCPNLAQILSFRTDSRGEGQTLRTPCAPRLTLP